MGCGPMEGVSELTTVANGASADGREVRFQKLTRGELNTYAERGATVLIPIGAIEQHASHLPVETDIFNSTTVSTAAAEHFDDVLVAPPIPWGLSDAHVPLGGTISLRPATFIELAMDITATLADSGFRRLCWVNGHNGNKGVMTVIVYESKRLHGLSVGAVTYYDLAVSAYQEARTSGPGGSGHACEFETSLMLHLNPEAVGDYTSAAVRMIEGRTPNDFGDLADPGLTAIGYTFPERFPEGIMGDPTVAEAETGRLIYEASLKGVVAFLGEFRAHPPEGVRVEA